MHSGLAGGEHREVAVARLVAAQVEPPVDGVDALVRVRQVMRDAELDVVGHCRPRGVRLRMVVRVKSCNVIGFWLGREEVSTYN